MRKNIGITLVALIITVIIMLILAGIGISLIAGEEGLFSKAKIAAEKYNNASKNEAETLSQIISVGNLPDGSWSAETKVNKPDTSKLPVATTKYVIWTESGTFVEQLSNTEPSNWYDYNNSKWANVKTGANGLEAYWVWIPRFAYKLPESTTAKTIEVAFAKGNGTTVVNPVTGAEETAYYAADAAITSGGSELYKDKTADAHTKWIIHPAFKFGSKQLAGIWVAKYEASSSNPSANDGGGDTIELKVQVKPSVASWRTIEPSYIFTVCRAIQNDGGALGTTTGLTAVDTHMMKNMEWGAVAILSQSKYGYYEDATNKKVWNNPNSSYITGTATKTVNGQDAGSLEDSLCDRYNEGNGIKASTTGNVYGVYDMAGGAFEYVAAGYEGNISVQLGTTDEKYYNSYTNPTNNSNDYTGGKIGDLTAELKPSWSTWNGDDAYFVKTDLPIFTRGNYGWGSRAGIFEFSYGTGNANSTGSFRPVLVVM